MKARLLPVVLLVCFAGMSGVQTGPGATPFIPHTLRTCLQKISFSANWSWREVPAVCVRIPALGL